MLGTQMLVLALASATACATAVNVTGSHRVITISNTQPRLSVNGEIVNSHDGTIRWIDGFFWLHAASYGAGGCQDPPHQGCEGGRPPKCGFQSNHNVRTRPGSQPIACICSTVNVVCLAVDQSNDAAGVDVRPLQDDLNVLVHAQRVDWHPDMRMRENTRMMWRVQVLF